LKPIKNIRPHPQLPNHFLIVFADGTKNIASTAKLEQLKLLPLIQSKSKEQ
jgi:hypothetical protein